MRLAAFLLPALLAILPTAVFADNTTVPCEETYTELCVDGPGTKVINGVSVYKDCWRSQLTYRCAVNDVSNQCQPLRDQGCQQVTSTCMESDSYGCVIYDQTYKCPTKTIPGETYTDCGTQTFCANGNCFDTGYNKDQDFAKAITGIEFLREAGQYPDEQGFLFKGFPATCNNKLSIGSEGNCCAARTEGGQLSNYVALKTAVDVGDSLAGSTYAYDALFASDAPQWALDAFNTVFTSGGSNSALASLVTGDFTVSQYIQAVGPATIGLTIAIQVYSSWVQCEADDMKVNIKRDSGLCHFVGSYCSSSLNLLLVKICLVNTQAYCCFNSKLARIVQEGVRPQLGMDWGNAEQPNCVGLSATALQAVDWSQVDLSEFYAEIKAKMPAQTDLVQKSQQKYQNYFLQK